MIISIKKNGDIYNDNLRDIIILILILSAPNIPNIISSKIDLYQVYHVPTNIPIRLVSTNMRLQEI